MRKIVLLAACLSAFCFSDLKAQQPFYKTYTWDAVPKVAPADSLDVSEGQITLKDLRVIEYVYEKSGDLMAYITRHRKVKVFSDKGIEENNKIYIPSSGVIDFMDIQARSISPGGKVTNIAKSDIKDVDDVENKGSYKMFAVDGIEKNSEVEYVYTYKKNASYFGTEYCQNAIPRHNFLFKIISPSNLQFDVRVYNAAEGVRPDTATGERNSVTVSMASVPKMKAEKYSFYNTNLTRIEYKLAYNALKGKMRLLTWDNAADRYYSIFYNYTKKEVSAVNSFLKKIRLSGDEVAKVHELENQIKLKFELRQGDGEEAENIEKVIDNHYSNYTGRVRMFMCCLNQLGIKRDLVLTCSREDARFDAIFDSWNFLDVYLIYLPGSGTYFSPTDILSRVGFVPPEYSGQKGLFVKEVDLGETKSGIAKIKEISYQPYTESSSGLAANVKFNDDLSEAGIKIEMTYSGYGAYYSQPVINFFTDLRKREFQESTLKVTGEDTKMDNVNMSGYASEDILVKPFVMTADLKSKSVVEKAGNKHLFRIGTLIGPQTEMYQESTRKTPVEIAYTHGYVRRLTVEVPAGYKVSGLENLNMNTEVKENNEVTAEFKSTYKMEGSRLEVTVLENYRKLYYPVSSFEDYRKVINAAANFNKIVLIIEKA
jgi:hypothetical protein